jgi:hypothetical protein
VALLGACGGPTYSVGSSNVTVADQGWYRQPFFCTAAAMDQLAVTLYDDKPYCGSSVLTTAPDGGSSSTGPMKDHHAIRLYFALSGHPNNMVPYDVKKPDCNLGPAGPGWASLVTFPGGGGPTTETYADSGTMTLAQWDPSGVQPAKGTFDVTISGSRVKGNFEAFGCK